MFTKKPQNCALKCAFSIRVSYKRLSFFIKSVYGPAVHTVWPPCIIFTTWNFSSTKWKIRLFSTAARQTHYYHTRGLLICKPLSTPGTLNKFLPLLSLVLALSKTGSFCMLQMSSHSDGPEQLHFQHFGWPFRLLVQRFVWLEPKWILHYRHTVQYEFGSSLSYY